MFTLYDNRNELFQWDLNRKVVIEDTTIDKVHFCNKTSDCSLVVEPYWEDALYVADIPNILLQNDFPIRVYAYCDDGYTKIEETFKVKTRTKPSDYLYEETRVFRIDEVITKAEEAVELAGQSATEANKTATDLYEYVNTHTLSFTDDGQGNVTLQAIGGGSGDVDPTDLSNYYTKAETNAAIDTAIEGIEIPEVDLSPYATQQFVLDKVAEIDIPEVPKNVSAFTNDSGYLTEHQDISGKADKEHTHPQYLTEHQSLAGYATEEYVTQAIAGSAHPEPDLSNYYTKEEVNALFNGIATAEGGSY